MNPTAIIDSMEVVDTNNEIAQSSMLDSSSSSSSSEDSGDGLHDPEPDNHDDTVADSIVRDVNRNSQNGRESKRISTNKQLSYFLGFKDKTPPPQTISASKSASHPNESMDAADAKPSTSYLSPDNTPAPVPVIELTMEPECTRENFNRTVIIGRQQFDATSLPEGETVITGTSALDALRFESGSTQTFTRCQLVQESSDELRTVLRESLGKPTALTCGFANVQPGNPPNPLKITAVAMLSEATDIIVAVTITAKPGCKLVANSYGIKRVVLFSQGGKQVIMEKYFNIVVNNEEDDASGSKSGTRRAEVVESKGCCFYRPKASKLPDPVAKEPAAIFEGQDNSKAVILASDVDRKAVVIEDEEAIELKTGAVSNPDRTINALAAPLPIDMSSAPISADVALVSKSVVPKPVTMESALQPVEVLPVSTPVDMTPAPMPIAVMSVSEPLITPPVITPAASKPVATASIVKPVPTASVMEPVFTPPIITPAVSKPVTSASIVKPVIIDKVPESTVESPKKKLASNSSAPITNATAAAASSATTIKKKDDDCCAPAKDNKVVVAGSTDCCGNVKKNDDSCAPAKKDNKAQAASVSGSRMRTGSPSEEKSGPVGSDDCCPLNDLDEDEDHDCCPSGAGAKKTAKPVSPGDSACCTPKKNVEVVSDKDCCGKQKKDNTEAAAKSSGCCAPDQKEGSVPVVGSEKSKGLCCGSVKPAKKDVPSASVKKMAPPVPKTGLQYDGCRATGFCLFVPYFVWPWKASTYKPTTLPRTSPNYRPEAKNRI